MKKHILLALALVGLFGFQILSNCADPLQTVTQVPTGTIQPVHDTIYQLDTVIVKVIDSVAHTDTVMNIDTVVQVDTVFIVNHDSTTCARTLCSRIDCKQKAIVWMFHNDAGDYQLSFVASAGREQPTKTLTLSIDTQEFTWDTKANSTFNVTLHLGENSTIRIISDDPSAYGHSIDVCLKLSKS